MTYAFTHMGNFLLLLLLLFHFEGFGHQSWDLGLKAGILASRLGFEGGDEEEKDEGGEGENPPYV